MSPGVCIGRPRFTDSALAATAAREGDAAAWRQAFADHGSQAPSGVAGDFAIAMHDGHGRAFLAIDRFAIRTLCYRQMGAELVFAERADSPAFGPPEIDPQAVFEYLFFHFIPAPRTIFKDVFRVPAGHYILFEDGKLTRAPYWTPAFEENRHEPFAELRDEFRQILRNCVSDQVDAGTIGCFLSGGTDSSTVAGMLGEVSGRPAPTYSIGFEAEGYDEMEYARIAARRFGTVHHEHYLTPDELVRSFGDVATYYDQPFGNSSALPAYYCARMARADGTTKLLAGDGGDELFGGNTRYAKQRIFGWYEMLPASIRSGAVEPLAASPMKSFPLLRKACSYVEQARVQMPQRLQMYNIVVRLGVENVFTPALLVQVDRERWAAQQVEDWNRPRASSLVNRMLAFDWRYTLAENDLPKVCGTAALAGIEVGFPLLDDRLVEFSMRLPPEYKLKGLTLRWFFKKALKGFLPDEIIAKKKHGFGLPFGVWTMRHPQLQQLAEEALRSFARRGIVRAEFIDQLLRENLPAYPGYYGEMVWVMMVMEHWFLRHAPDYRLPA